MRWRGAAGNHSNAGAASSRKPNQNAPGNAPPSIKRFWPVM